MPAPPTKLEAALRWVHQVTVKEGEPRYALGGLSRTDVAALRKLAGVAVPADLAKYYAKYRPAEAFDIEKWRIWHARLASTYGAALFPLTLADDTVEIVRVRSKDAYDIKQWWDGAESGGGSDLVGYLVPTTIAIHALLRR